MSAQGSHLGTRGLKSATAGMSLGGGHIGSDWSGEVLSLQRVEQLAGFATLLAFPCL